MQYVSRYQSPVGEILLAADEAGLTGYAGGIDKKMMFLKLEGGYKDTFFVPKHSTAP